MTKCKFYLAGLQHLGLVTDHRHLVPILNSCSLDDIGSSSLQCLKDMSAFTYTANLCLGKKLCIRDALSRSPVGKPTLEDDMLDAETSFSVRCITLCAVESLAADVNYGGSGQSSDVTMDEFLRAASEDPAYSELLHCVRAGFPRDRYALRNTVRPYWKLRDNLYSEDDLVLYGARFVVPAAFRRHVLARLLDSHRGAEST